jgi:hypothetical protein
MTASVITRDTIALLDDMTASARTAELPAPPYALQHLRARLADDTYHVLVVGEAKRGKSTFVNALIGEDLLPTDVGIATSHVFAVRRAVEEDYRLRFEDGSSRPIARDDLERYGSEASADRDAPVDGGPPLRWIEVDVPARFLPERLGLLDTPGLGALYAEHAEITRRFVPQADAVVMVLDSGQPVGQRELDLLTSVLQVTPHVFFIQTKIDQHAREAWEATRRRSQAILAERFGDQLGTPEVWPISSQNLRRAADATAPDAFLLVSRYRELSEALLEFLNGVCSAPRVRDALLIAGRQHMTGGRILDARLQAVAESDDRAARRHREAAASRSKQFDVDWGEKGAKRRELLAGVRRVTTLGKQAFREALQPGGRVTGALEERIDATKTLEEVNALGHTLASEAIAAATDEWVRVGDMARERYAELLAPFLEDLNALLAGGDDADLAIDVGAPNRSFTAVEDRMFDRFKGASGAVGAIGLALAFVAPVIAPLAVPLAFGGMLWAARRGWKDVGETRLKAAQQELHRHLRATLQHVHQHFFAVDVAVGRFCRVDEHFTMVEASVMEQVDAVVRRRIEETQDEINRLESQAQLEASERAAERARVTGLQEDWKALGKRIAELADRVLQTTASPATKEAA